MRKSEYKLQRYNLLCLGLSMQTHNMVQKTTTVKLPKASEITGIKVNPEYKHTQSLVLKD
jgi:hypothetical protein